MSTEHVVLGGHFTMRCPIDTGVSHLDFDSTGEDALGNGTQIVTCGGCGGLVMLMVIPSVTTPLMVAAMRMAAGWSVDRIRASMPPNVVDEFDRLLGRVEADRIAAAGVEKGTP